MPNLEFDVDGLDDTLLRIRAVGGEISREIMEILDTAADIAFVHELSYVPIGETARLEFSLRRTPVTYRPGGLGGGGFYEVEVGPENPPEHIDWVLGGTRDIVGKPMFIQKHGEPGHWINKRRGQKPQTEWITGAQDKARDYIRQRVETLDLFNE